jgi:hypothetical protein
MDKFNMLLMIDDFHDLPSRYHRANVAHQQMVFVDKSMPSLPQTPLELKSNRPFSTRPMSEYGRTKR